MRIKRFLFLILAFFILYSNSFAYALEEKMQVNEGETFAVSLSISSDKYDNQGINVYTMKIDYDKSIFEPLRKSDFKSLGKWEDVIYNPENGKITAVNYPGAKSSDDVVEVTFKVKEDAKAQKTDIKVSDILVSANDEEIKYEDQMLAVDVIQKELLPGDTINLSENNNKKDAIEEKKNLFESKEIILLLTIILLVIVEVSLIILIKKGFIKNNFIVKNKNISLLLLNSILVLEVCIFGAMVIRTSNNFNDKNSNKYEVNHKDNDDNKNSKIEEMQKALIQLESSYTKKENKDKDDSVQNKDNESIKNTDNGNKKPSANNSKEEDKKPPADNGGGESEPPANGDKEDNENPPASGDIEENENPSADNGGGESEPPVNGDKEDNENPPADNDGGESEPPANGDKEDNENPPVNGDTEENENPPVDNDGGESETPPSIGDIEAEVDKEYEDKVNKTNILDFKFDYYPNKNSALDIVFTIDQDVEVDKLVVDGVEYLAKMIGDREFKVQLTSAKESGIQELNISELKILPNYKKDVNKTIKLDVLKEKPQIEMASYKEDASSDNKSTNISFNLIDNDKSITNSYVNIKDSKGKIYKKFAIKAGVNNINIPLIVDEKYTAEIIVDYDLDTNELNNVTGSTNEVEKEVLLEKPIQLVRSYDFSVGGIQVEKVDGIYGRGDKIKVYINSSNSSEFEPEYVKINDKYYTLKKVDNKSKANKNIGNIYMAEVDAYDTIGEQTIEVQEIILKNGKSFVVEEFIPEEESNSVEVEIVKKKPFVSDLTVTENVEKSILNVNVDITDEDNVLAKRKLILKDSQGNILDDKEFSNNKEEITLNTKLTNKYIIQVIADYDTSINNNNLVRDELIYEKEITAQSKVVVKDFGVSSYYLEKNSEVNAYYSFDRNTESEISKIVINNVELNLEKNDDKEIPYEYVVKLPLSDVSGVVELDATKVIFDDSSEVSISNKQKIEVLKDAPILKYESVTSDINTNTVTFKFDIEDKENTLISAKAILGTNEQIAQVGSNKLTFAINSGEILDFKVLATYDRDTNAINDITGEKNLVTDSEIFKESVQLVEDYELEISELKTVKENNESKYFDKNENILVEFKSTNNSKFIPEKVTVNKIEYTVTSSNDKYYFTISGLQQSGYKQFEVENITLSNGKVLAVDKNNELEIEILKTAPTVNKFKWDEGTKGKLKISFALVDDDSTLKNATLTVENRNRKRIKKVKLKSLLPSKSKVVVGENEINLNVDGSEEYFVNLTADYDLDTDVFEDGANEHENKNLLNEVVAVKSRSVELKDITSIDVYREGANGDNEIVKKIDLNQKVNLDDYLVKVNMKNLPSIYAKIKEYKVVDDELKLVLDYDNVVQYDGSKSQESIEVYFGYVKDNVASDPSFEELVEEIKNNPSGTFKLKKDFDASGITTGNAVIDTFTGVLDGNGHTISGLKIPLFGEVNNGEIKNLQIKDSKFSRGWGVHGSSIFINYTTNAKVSNIIIDNIDLTGGYRTAAVVGEDKRGSTFDNITIKNSIVYGGMTHSGVFMGVANGSIISNVEIVNTRYRTAGNYYNASFIGITTGKTDISNVVTDIEMLGGGGNQNNSGFIGKVSNTEKIKNIVTLGNSNSSYYKTLSQADANSKVISNSFEKDSTTGINNTDNPGIDQVNEEVLKTEEFYRNTVGLDANLWDFSDVAINGYPSLKHESMENPKYDIPNNKYLSKLDNYDLDRVQIYENMQKLMPFTDSEYIVIDGNKISKSHEFNQKKIRTVFPVDENGKRIIALTEKNYNNISKIKVLFEDDSVEEYNIKSKDLTNNIARYNIADLNVEYNFNKYIQNDDSIIVKELAEKIKNFDYDKDILTKPKEMDDIPRLFRDHYNQSIKGRAEEIAIALVANNSEYATYSDDTVLYNLIKKELIENDYLKEFMYVFTYVDRWYDFDIAGINLRDIVLFDNTIFNKKHSTRVVVKDFIENSSSGGRKGDNTHGLYTNRFSQFIGLTNVDEFIEYLIRTFDNPKYKDDINTWIFDNFQGGVIYESLGEFEGGDNLDQRLWSYLKQNSRSPRGRLLLPILSYKGKDLYIFSVPTQIAFGNLNLYSEYKNDDESRAVMQKKVAEVADTITYFYENAAKIVKDPVSALNSLRQIQLDSTRINGPGQMLDFNTTEDSVYKNIYLPLYWRDGGHNSAVADGSGVTWNNEYLLSNSYLSTFTHETAHNQDNRLFLENNDQRRDPWSGEDFANGFITQNFATGEYNMNISKDFGRDSSTTSNLTPDRITSPDKIKDFYGKVFDVLDIMDYLQAEAFLKLTPEQQSNIAQQHVYKNGNKRDSMWVNKSAKDFENMNLNEVEDLYDNQINIIPNRVNSNVVNYYNQDMVYYTHWYQPYNDDGKPNSIIFKRNYWYLLSKYGYTDGLVKYSIKINGKDMGDLDRMKLITGDENFTWRSFALDRFNGIEDKINKSAYIDKEEIVNEFYNAFIKDASLGGNNLNHNPWGRPANESSMNARLDVYRYLQRITDDFRNDVYSENVNKVHITTGAQFIEEIKKNPNGYFVLENDIELQDVENSEVIIDETFIGKIEGNGHAVYGITKPIFKNVRHSYISDLAIKTEINGPLKKDLLGKSVSGTIIAEDTIYEANISSIEGLKSINNRPSGTYILTKDIDASSVKGEALITKDFKGKLIGNGYTITGLKVPLFKNLVGTVENLKIKDATINKGNEDYANAFAKSSEGAEIKDIELYNVNVTGNNYVSPFIGNDKNSNISKIAIKKSTVSTSGDYGSGFIGKTEGTNIENVVIGDVEQTLGNKFNAGFIGNAINTKSLNTYVLAYMIESNTMDESSTAGFVGTSNESEFENVIVGSHVPDNIKIIMPTEEEILSSIKNGYELDILSGISNINSNTTSILKETTLEKVGDSDFLTNEAKFDSNIWDNSKVSQLLYPEVKGLQNYSQTSTYKILSTRGLKTIDRNPSGKYQLGKDIDVSSYGDEVIVKNNFTGTLDGNGFTIKGLKNALFENLQGTVTNVKLKDININAVGKNYVNVLAKSSNKANVNNVHLENINIDGNNNTAVISGKDTGSTFNNISIKSANVGAKGQYSGVFIGDSINSNISNILILDSTINISQNYSGGFIGYMTQSIVDKVFVDVDSNFDNYSVRPFYARSAGFIGDIKNNPGAYSKITNSISVGNVSNPEIFKFVGSYLMYTADSHGSNNFELTEATGKLLNKNFVRPVPKAELETEEFYRNRVTFDESIWDLSTVSNGHPILKSIN